MDRLNNQGLQRNRLIWAMKRPDFVPEARRLDECLLCKAHGVNEAGVCEGCYSLLTAAELNIAERWLAGAMPQ